MQGFRDLRVWQRSHGLALAVYRASVTFPSQERFGLTLQLRRAAVSVPTNSAEGSKRLRKRDYVRLLDIAEGSIAETEYLLQLSTELGFMPAGDARGLANEASQIARMLNALREKVETRAAP